MFAYQGKGMHIGMFLAAHARYRPNLPALKTADSECTFMRIAVFQQGYLFYQILLNEDMPCSMASL